MNIRDKSSLPPYLHCVNVKHVYKSIKYKTITSQVHNTDHYDSHCVPLTATLLKTIKKRNYIPEYPDLTYCTSQKRLMADTFGSSAAG